MFPTFERVSSGFGLLRKTPTTVVPRFLIEHHFCRCVALNLKKTDRETEYVQKCKKHTIKNTCLNEDG